MTDRKRTPGGLACLQLALKRSAWRSEAVRPALWPLAVFTVALVITGCTTAGTPITGGSGPTSYNYLTGNWVLQVTPTSGGTPFTTLSGFINEEDDKPGVNDNATAAFQAQPSTCYLGADIVPWYGYVYGTPVDFYSFDVNGQFVTIKATKNAAATQLTGTYSIAGGCANGDTGTITGTRYAVLKGTYAGSLANNSAQSMQLTLAQNVTGTGSGTFFVSGTATFAGFSCFTTGTMASTSGSIIGNTVQLNFTTNDVNGSNVILSGTIDPTAITLTLTSGSIQGGDCSGSLGTGTLTLQ